MKLATQSRSLRIDEARRADLDLDGAVAERIARKHALADALPAPPQQTEPDPMAERRRECHRRDHTLIVFRARFGAVRQEVCARPQPLGAIERPETRNRWTLRI